MSKKISGLLAGLIFILLASPMFLYWWGIANMESPPVPSQMKLSIEREQEIWDKEKETGSPRVNKITPYGYILYVRCNINTGLHSSECMSKYPGLRVSALAVRNQVAMSVSGKRNVVWQVTWLAYTIWITRNWDVHQILSTYYEAYNT